MSIYAKELAENLLFQGLAPAQLERLSGLFTPVQYRSGDTIFRQGDLASDVFVLETGEVALRHDAEDGGCLTIAVIQPEGIFGWSAALGRNRYTSYAVCVQDARALRASGCNLRDLVHSEPALGRLLLGRMALAVAGRSDGAHVRLARLIRHEMAQAALV